MAKILNVWQVACVVPVAETRDEARYRARANLDVVKEESKKGPIPGWVVFCNSFTVVRMRTQISNLKHETQSTLNLKGGRW